MDRKVKPRSRKPVKADRKPIRAPGGTSRPGRGKGAPEGHANVLQHGIYPAHRLMKDVAIHGSRSRALSHLLDKGQPWAKALLVWRDQLVQSYGGWKVMDPITHEVLAMATVMKVIVDSIGDYAAKNRVVDMRRRRLYPIVLDLDKLMTSQLNRLERFALLMDRQRAPIQSIEDIRTSLKDGNDEGK